MEGMRRSFGFPHGIDVTSAGSSGRLSMGWKSNVSVSLGSFSASHIDVHIDDDLDGNS